MKRRCYIAGYIGTLSEEATKEKFEKAKQEVIALGFEPSSPLELPHKHGRTWPEFMREDLIEMLKCDVVYVQNDVRHSHGTKIEVRLAMDVQIDIIFQK